MKQKSIEAFLGVSREDKFSGGQLIQVYRDYLATRESFMYDLLILHNEDDMKGMPSILPILNYKRPGKPGASSRYPYLQCGSLPGRT